MVKNCFAIRGEMRRLLNTMKQSPALAHAQTQMAPGVITREGFLGPDTRPLGDILEADDARVKRLGLTHAAIAARMRELRDAGKRGLGLSTEVEPHFDVQVESIRGRLPSPFGGRGVFSKTTTMVTNTRLNESVQYSDLQIHLVGVHGFYEGRNSKYRLDPEMLARVLEVEPVTPTD